MEEQQSPSKLLLAIGIIVASLSGAALVFHAFANIHVAATVTVMVPLTVILLVVVIMAKRIQGRDVFLQRIGAGLFAGLMGLVAYDLIRWIIMAGGIIPFNPFRAIEVFGLLILKTDVDTTLTKTVGWAFHVWNGLAFAVMYTLAFGRGRVWKAVAWSMLLEVAMIASYPTLFRAKLDFPFLSIGIIGHLAYGLALGYAARGAVKR